MTRIEFTNGSQFETDISFDVITKAIINHNGAKFAFVPCDDDDEVTRIAINVDTVSYIAEMDE